jgi:hypothetical protein
MIASVLSEWVSSFALKDYFTGISIFVTTLLAVLVSWMHNRYQKTYQERSFLHQNEIKQKESHSLLRLKAIDVHESFWNSKEMTQARKMISNESEYRAIEPILESRISKTECNLPPEDYEKLELIDQFYSAIMRLRRIQESLSAFGEDEQSNRMIRDCYGYWVEILDRSENDEGNRTALKDYLNRFWPGLVGCLPAGQSFGALTKSTNKDRDRGRISPDPSHNT